MKIFINKRFANNLVKLRKSKGLSQYDVAREMQLLGSTISRSTYSKIETGRANIKVSDLVALKEVYDIEYGAFFEGISVNETDNA